MFHSVQACKHRTVATVLIVAALAPLGIPVAACPFCGVVGESLAARRDAADCVAVGEADGRAFLNADGALSQRFRIDQVLRGDVPANGEAIIARVSGAANGTAILFCTTTDAAAPIAVGTWTAIAADEVLLGYIVAAPGLRQAAASRLQWFAARLEDPNPQIAQDAFVEFGLASFAAVCEAADSLDAKKLRVWVNEPGIDQRRHGFYGLALGIVASRSQNTGQATACIHALHEAIAAPADDFRSGFSGLLAGVLVAEGERGLDYLKSRGLFEPQARAVDQRHLLAALRFAWESLADTIPRGRTSNATAALLASPAVAADATIDLARYAFWKPVAAVADLWNTLGTEDPLVRRAVAGYLSACPLPAAKRQLEKIRAAQPELWQRALESSALLPEKI